MTVPTVTVQAAHRKAVATNLAELVQTLDEVLGRTLIAYITGVDRRNVGRWINETTKPRAEAEEKLRVAYQAVQLLLHGDSDHTVRAWFVGLNPQLDDVAPAEALRAGQLREVIVAAKSFTLGG